MKFNININASPQKVWQVLFCDQTYRQWTRPFFEGSYAKGSWEEGSHIHFLGPDGSGMYGIIENNTPNEYMAIKQIGELKDFKELPVDNKAAKWSGSMETYKLIPNDNGTDLEIGMGGSESEAAEEMSQAFYPGMEIIKRLSENPILIAVQVFVFIPIENVWKHWTLPEHIMQWNNASPDWHTTSAKNDLKDGGKFNYRMEAKDGSFGFDFSGVYSYVAYEKAINYTMDDGRTCEIDFQSNGEGILITQRFEAEEENTLELQKFGWQAIMDNFKNYSESSQ